MVALEVESLSQHNYKYLETNVKLTKINLDDFQDLRHVSPSSKYLIVARQASGSIQAVILEVARFAAYENIYITEISRGTYYDANYSRWVTPDSPMATQTVIVNPATWTYLKQKTGYELDRQLSDVQMMATNAQYVLEPVDAFGYISGKKKDVLMPTTYYWIVALVALIAAILFGGIAYYAYDRFKQP